MAGYVTNSLSVSPGPPISLQISGFWKLNLLFLNTKKHLFLMKINNYIAPELKLLLLKYQMEPAKVALEY